VEKPHCAVCHLTVAIYEPQFNLIGGAVVHEACAQWLERILKEDTPEIGEEDPSLIGGDPV